MMTKKKVWQSLTMSVVLVWPWMIMMGVNWDVIWKMTTFFFALCLIINYFDPNFDEE